MRSFYSLYPSVSMIYNVVAFYVVHYKVSKICSLSYFCWCTSNQLCRLILGVIWHFLCVWLFHNIIKQMGRSNKSTFKMRWKYCLLSFTKHQKLFYFTILEIILKSLIIFDSFNFQCQSTCVYSFIFENKSELDFLVSSIIDVRTHGIANSPKHKSWT